jgi:muramoyltetrapeptide carboxypeptidase LdcA involved in peptidoglycan recycling
VTPIRPPRLRPGDTVAVVAPSWGGPAAFPAVFDAGLDVLRSLGLAVREYPATRAAAASVGDDAVRLLPHLDPAPLRRDPKIVMGYSDTCALLA